MPATAAGEGGRGEGGGGTVENNSYVSVTWRGAGGGGTGDTSCGGGAAGGLRFEPDFSNVESRKAVTRP